MEDKHLESTHSFDDTYVGKEEFFGHPYKELQDYFIKYAKKGTLLDLGCGQGRDSIFLASLGYKVTAVDNSSVGINQMLKKAKQKGIKIKGMVADVLNLQLEEKFDIILFDMLLHSFEKSQQLALLKKYSKNLNKKGIVCIVFPDDMGVDYFMNILQSLPYKWNLLDEIIIKDVPTCPDIDEETDYTFTMAIIQFSS